MEVCTEVWPNTVQQVELTAKPVEITEHVAAWYRCRKAAGYFPA